MATSSPAPVPFCRPSQLPLPSDHFFLMDSASFRIFFLAWIVMSEMGTPSSSAIAACTRFANFPGLSPSSITMGSITVHRKLIQGRKLNQNRFARKLEVRVCVLISARGEESRSAIGTTGTSRLKRTNPRLNCSIPAPLVMPPSGNRWMGSSESSGSVPAASRSYTAGVAWRRTTRWFFTCVTLSGRAAVIRWMYFCGRVYRTMRSPAVRWLLTRTCLLPCGRCSSPSHVTEIPRSVRKRAIVVSLSVKGVSSASSKIHVTILVAAIKHPKGKYRRSSGDMLWTWVSGNKRDQESAVPLVYTSPLLVCLAGSGAAAEAFA
mmetsp:Transcript_36070/g.102119  ORF Transcript_36070/g.102119 Transcript_36070/m.102119 type:complete len:320 (-) Transcript_36070:526-1485(-)